MSYMESFVSNKDVAYSVEELTPKGVRNYMVIKSKVAQGKSANGRPYYPTTGYEYYETKAGRFELSDWVAQVEKAIENEGNTPLLESIRKYCRENTPWLKKEDDIRLHAAECFLNKAYEHWDRFSL